MANNNKKTAAELRAENRLLRRFGIGQNITKIVTAGIKYGVIGGILWKGFNSTEEVAKTLAGRNTIADVNVGVGLNADIGMEIALSVQSVMLLGATALLVAFVGIAYGLRQDKLRKDVLEKLAPYRKMYELSVDQNRSSSRLSARGDEAPVRDLDDPPRLER